MISPPQVFLGDQLLLLGTAPREVPWHFVCVLTEEIETAQAIIAEELLIAIDLRRPRDELLSYEIQTRQIILDTRNALLLYYFVFSDCLRRRLQQVCESAYSEDFDNLQREGL